MYFLSLQFYVSLGRLCFKQTVECEGFFCDFGFSLIVGNFWCVMPIAVNLLQKQKFHYSLLNMPYCMNIRFVGLYVYKKYHELCEICDVLCVLCELGRVMQWPGSESK